MKKIQGRRKKGHPRVAPPVTLVKNLYHFCTENESNFSFVSFFPKENHHPSSVVLFLLTLTPPQKRSPWGVRPLTCSRVRPRVRLQTRLHTIRGYPGGDGVCTNWAFLPVFLMKLIWREPWERLVRFVSAVVLACFARFCSRKSVQTAGCTCQNAALLHSETFVGFLKARWSCSLWKVKCNEAQGITQERKSLSSF